MSLRGCLLGVGSMFLINGFALAQDFQPGFGINEENVSQVSVPGVEADQEEGLLNVIKRVINYVLGLLALIVLILFVYGGLQVIFGASSDDAHKKALTIVRNAAIGLAIIAFAWLLVSFLFTVLAFVTSSGG